MISLEKWENTSVIVGSISAVTSGNFSEIGKTKTECAANSKH